MILIQTYTILTEPVSGVSHGLLIVIETIYISTYQYVNVDEHFESIIKRDNSVNRYYFQRLLLLYY